MIDTKRRIVCKGYCKQEKNILEFKVLAPGMISYCCKECRAKQAENKWMRKHRKGENTLRIF